MSAQARPQFLKLPMAGIRAPVKARLFSLPSIRVKPGRFLLGITFATWTLAVLVSVVFYFSVLNHWKVSEWLAVLLAGTVGIGWFVTALYLCKRNQ